MTSAAAAAATTPPPARVRGFDAFADFDSPLDSAPGGSFTRVDWTPTRAWPDIAGAGARPTPTTTTTRVPRAADIGPFHPAGVAAAAAALFVDHGVPTPECVVKRGWADDANANARGGHGIVGVGHGGGGGGGDLPLNSAARARMMAAAAAAAAAARGDADASRLSKRRAFDDARAPPGGGLIHLETIPRCCDAGGEHCGGHGRCGGDGRCGGGGMSTPPGQRASLRRPSGSAAPTPPRGSALFTAASLAGLGGVGVGVSRPGPGLVPVPVPAPSRLAPSPRGGDPRLHPRAADAISDAADAASEAASEDMIVEPDAAAMTSDDRAEELKDLARFLTAAADMDDDALARDESLVCAALKHLSLASSVTRELIRHAGLQFPVARLGERGVASVRDAATALAANAVWKQAMVPSPVPSMAALIGDGAAAAAAADAEEVEIPLVVAAAEAAAPGLQIDWELSDDGGGTGTGNGRYVGVTATTATGAGGMPGVVAGGMDPIVSLLSEFG